jgi:glycerol dehydrogenase
MEKLLAAPSRFVIGADALDELGRCINLLGKRTFIIGGKTALSKVESRVTKTLAECGVQVVGTCRGVSACTHKEIEQIVETGRRLQPDLCLGMGGGTVSDAAKAVAFRLGVPVALAPTICTTNADSTACSVIYSSMHEFLELMVFPRNPELVVVDTRLMVEARKDTIQLGMGDALAARFEAEACHASQARNIHGGLGTSLSLAAARVCFDKLMAHGTEAKLAADNGLLTGGVEEVIEAVKLLSAFAWEGSGTAAAHAMHSGLTYIETVAPPHNMHGEIVAFCTIAQLVLERRREDEIRAIIQWCSEVQLPVTLADLGGPDDAQLERAADKACDPRFGMANMPFRVTPSMVHDAWLVADLLGRRFLEGKPP